MRNKALKKLQFDLSGGVVVASRHWRRVCHGMTTQHGLSEACAAPLLVVGRLGDGVRQVTVAQSAGLEGPSLVRLLDQLCASGYVCRVEDEVDRRAKLLHLTEAGRALYETLETELVRLREQVLAGIPESDLEAALRVMRAFERAGQGGSTAGSS